MSYRKPSQNRMPAAAVGAILLTALLTGCGVRTPGTTRVLGDVSYADAFATSTETIAQHFSILSADAGTGEIRCRPKPVAAKDERLFSGSPARHLASLHLLRKDGLVVAQAAVAIQREGSSIHQARRNFGENYDGVPNLTPAEDTASITPQQEQLWQTESYDVALERRILDEIYNALTPATK